jgi:hypothetical protein
MSGLVLLVVRESEIEKLLSLSPIRGWVIRGPVSFEVRRLEVRG